MSYPKKKNDGIYDAYLAHHGILGMHWGIRRYQNPDGTLTSAGRSRYGKKPLTDKQIDRAEKKLRDISNKKNVEYNYFRELGIDRKTAKQASKEIRQQYQDILDEQKRMQFEIDTMFDKELLTADRDTINYNGAVAEVANRLHSKKAGFDEYKHEYSKEYVDNKEYEKLTASEFAKLVANSTHGNTDAYDGFINVYSIHADDNNLIPKVNKLQKNLNTLQREKEKAVRDIASKVVEDIGNERVSNLVNEEYYRGMDHYIKRQIERSRPYDGNESYWNADIWSKYGSTGNEALDNAKKAEQFTDQDREYIKRARKLCSNLPKKDKNAMSNWDYLNKAVEELGIANKPADELTKADWNKINKQITVLRNRNN